MKISGAEFMEWYDHHFPKGYFWDSDDVDELHHDDGAWKLEPAATYDTDDLGEIYENDPTYGDDRPEIVGLTVDKAIKAWRRSRDSELVIAYVPKAKAEDVRSYLKGIGAKFAAKAPA